MSKDVLEQPECPVCTQYMLPPSTLCGNGHNICSSCKKKLRNCPTCTEPFFLTQKNAMEKLALPVECPCPNEPHGGTLTFPIALIREHQEVCEYNPLACPLRKLVHCRWKEPFEEVKHNVT
jgi:E3 ubiquitin-protein ligase SIAH1